MPTSSLLAHNTIKQRHVTVRLQALYLLFRGSFKSVSYSCDLSTPDKLASHSPHRLNVPRMTVIAIKDAKEFDEYLSKGGPVRCTCDAPALPCSDFKGCARQGHADRSTQQYLSLSSSKQYNVLLIECRFRPVWLRVSQAAVLQNSQVDQPVPGECAAGFQSLAMSSR